MLLSKARGNFRPLELDAVFFCIGVPGPALDRVYCHLNDALERVNRFIGLSAQQPHSWS